MSDNHFFTPTTSIPIPKIFWSDLTSKPFESCVMCEKNLLENGEQYLIEKALKGYRGVATTSTIFEYAMCLNCAEKMRATLSTDSKNKIDAYYSENVNFDERRNSLKDNLSPEEWLKECLLDKKEASDGGEFQIYGQCFGDHLILHDFPFMLRGEAVDRIVDLLSPETLDELNGFMQDLTSGPPEFQELLKIGGPKIFV